MSDKSASPVISPDGRFEVSIEDTMTVVFGWLTAYSVRIWTQERKRRVLKAA
jgi:hypothetical protein